MKVLLAACLALALGAAEAARCTATSPDHTVALVELYTADACDTCLPADRWLASLDYPRDRVVPVALHVDLRDYAGKADANARQALSGRQKKMARLARVAITHTPRVLLQGQEIRSWGTDDFPREIARINGGKAKARIALSVEGPHDGSLEVEASAASAEIDAALYLAAVEHRKAPREFVVLQWFGPLEIKAAQRISLPLLAGAARGQSGVVAFVQSRENGGILQALMVPACPA